MKIINKKYIDAYLHINKPRWPVILHYHLQRVPYITLPSPTHSIYYITISNAFHILHYHLQRVPYITLPSPTRSISESSSDSLLNKNITTLDSLSLNEELQILRKMLSVPKECQTEK